MILDTFTISWLVSHPDFLLLFLKSEARRAKTFHGKKSPERRAWKQAKKEALTFVRLLNAMEDMTDEAEIYGMNERVEVDVRSSGSFLAVKSEAEQAKERVIESFHHALVLEEQANLNKAWFQRTLRNNTIIHRAHSLILSEEGTPWQKAWERAKGVFF
jgi:hypothetical protein